MLAFAETFMGIKLIDEADSKTDAGTWVPWKKDADSGKVIRFRLRPVPASFDRAQRARFNRGIKSKNVGDRQAVEVVESNFKSTRERALYALLDSENFEIEIGGESTAAAVSELLGVAGAAPGQVVLVDGQWPKLGNYLLELMPPLAAWINEKADDLAKLEADEEEELGKI
jgi:hypothetical protein